MAKSKEEKELLARLNDGEFDGPVGSSITTSGGSSVYTTIEDGVPTRHKEGPGGKFFDGKENVRYPGVDHILQTWEEDDDKLEFLQDFGWLIKDKAAQAYSAKFKK